MLAELHFNPKKPAIMHIDLNSCFATIEQQANPHLRGRPIAVAAYASPNGCIIAPSVEAKRLGVRVGMRVKEGRMLCPDLIIRPPDPWKYRDVHLALRRIISGYTADFSPKSIDEFVLNLEGYPAYQKGMFTVAREIKARIRQEIGEWITVSVGIAPNRFLAKTAAGLNKPDGLDEINKDNYLDIYSKLTLTDLCGIKLRSALRLNAAGIYSVNDFFKAPYPLLKAAFSSILGYYWYLRLRGWETCPPSLRSLAASLDLACGLAGAGRRVDEVGFARRSYGNSFALPACAGRPKPLINAHELSPILAKLVTKMGSRLRHAGYRARGVHLAITYRDHSFWHKGKTVSRVLFDSRDIYKEVIRLLTICPYRKPVRELFVSVFNLTKASSSQLALFEDVERKERLVRACDKINERWGSFVITPARMANTKDLVPDRIAFGLPADA